MAQKKGGLCHRHREKERERDQLLVEIGMLRGYIGEMWGQWMSIPTTPYILGRDLLFDDLSQSICLLLQD